MFDLGSVKTDQLLSETAVAKVKTRYDGAFTYRADDKLAAKISRANELASRYLADANEAEETGRVAKAGKLFAKAQYWLDRYNKLVGNA
jgi:hypothetical protein